MASFLGMDTEQVRKVSKQVDQEAQKIQADINSIGKNIIAAQWKGKDREAFVNDWNNQKTQANKVCEMLRQTAKTMEKNAHEQDQTSSH